MPSCGAVTLVERMGWGGMGTRSQDNEKRVEKDALDQILAMSVG